MMAGEVFTLHIHLDLDLDTFYPFSAFIYFDYHTLYCFVLSLSFYSLLFTMLVRRSIDNVDITLACDSGLDHVFLSYIYLISG